MSKKILQDMVKIKRFKSRSVLREPAREEIRKNTRGEYIEEYPEIKQEERPERRSTEIYHRRKSRYAFWGVAMVSVLFLFGALSYLFTKVTVTVIPKVKEVALNESMSAVKNSGVEGLVFDLVSISGEESRIVKATEERDFSKRAEGTAVIYNNFSSANQLLSIDTRLEGSNGKMYKTKKQVYVPGMKGTTPGSIEVGIYAADPGEESNSTPLDFKIFGFKGTPKYSKFYGRSSGSLTGGFVGKSVYVPDAEKEKVKNELKLALKNKLFKKAEDQIPKGFVLFKDAAFLDIEEDLMPQMSSGTSLTIKVKGTLHGILFDESKLSQKIVKDKIKEYDGSPVYISNIKNLLFSLSSKDVDSLSRATSIAFKLSGKAQVVSKVDETKLIIDLLGKSKKDFKKVLLMYPSINSADLLISPFWKSSLPDKKKGIEIIVNYPKQ